MESERDCKLNHCAVHLKLTQHCKSSILQKFFWIDWWIHYFKKSYKIFKTNINSWVYCYFFYNSLCWFIPFEEHSFYCGFFMKRDKNVFHLSCLFGIPCPWNINNINNTSSLARWASLVVQMIKNPPAMWEIRVWSLGWEDPLEKGTATHSSILAWRIPWIEESDPWGRKELDTIERLSLLARKEIIIHSPKLIGQIIKAYRSYRSDCPTAMDKERWK